MENKWFKVLDNDIKRLMEKRHVYACLYEDSFLEDEKNYYKAKIDLIDTKVACYLECQSLLLKN